MNHSFFDMLHILSCSALGITLPLEANTDLPQVYRYATLHGVAPIIFPVIQENIAANRVLVPDVWFSDVKNRTMYAVLKNTNRQILVHKLIARFAEKNITYCLLKGEALSHLYAEPDFRISGDTDILVATKDKKKALAIIKEFGFEIEAEQPNSHHIACRHSIGGIVELHTSLYRELFADVWFDNQTISTEEYRPIKLSDGLELSTLGTTDGLIFVTLHFIKHFITASTRVRQLMDVLIYMVRYKDSIDWDRFYAVIDHLNFKKFVNQCIAIGGTYFHIPPPSLPPVRPDAPAMEKILTALYTVAEQTASETEDEKMYMRYTKERFQRFKEGNFKGYIKKWLFPAFLQTVFPSVKRLSKRYAYLEKRPFLYPVAWSCKLTGIVVGLLRGKKGTGKIVDELTDLKDSKHADEMMNLLRDLDMI